MTTTPEPLKLAERPVLEMQYPLCGACSTEVQSTGDQYECPSCGTAWPHNAGDGDLGELYEAWSGEGLDGPVVPNTIAWTISDDPVRRAAELSKIAEGVSS